MEVFVEAGRDQGARVGSYHPASADLAWRLEAHV